MANKLIYLDNAATTSVNPEVLKTYIQVVETYFANPSSIHFEGQKSARLLDKAREQIVSCFKLPSHTCIFTSGATESNNLALKGVALRYNSRGKHIIVSNVEHPSILETAKQLQEYFGFEVTYLPVNNFGCVSSDTLKSAIRDDTLLVSIMAVNNETGAINPIEEVAKLLKQYPKIIFHVDATQAVGKIDINYKDVDLISYSGHKIHCLNGCGALLKRNNIELIPVLSGGGQEFGLRSGTNDVALAASLAKATRLACETLKTNFDYVMNLYKEIKDYFENNKELYDINSYSSLNPYILNFSLKTKKASVVVEGLSNENIMVSSISACHSKGEPISEVIKAMGKDEHSYRNTIRVSFDKSNTLDDIRTFISTLDRIVRGIKQ